MHKDMTVEEMLKTSVEVQNNLFRNEWSRLMHAEEDPVLAIDTSDFEAA